LEDVLIIEVCSITLKKHKVSVEGRDDPDLA
jgi:predicted RNA-binding protein